jgi:erythromycin esterase
MLPNRPNSPSPVYATLDAWIAHESIPFALGAPDTFNAAVDEVMAALSDGVELLGLGEALHGGEELLILRNRLFQRLVEAHGYRAIALESSFPRARVVNEYVAGSGADVYAAVAEAGFSHGFGRLEANRELVEWMRCYNADPGHRIPLQFYGFDGPMEMMGAESPRQLLHFVLKYLAAFDPSRAAVFHDRIGPLLGEDTAWGNSAAMMDPAQSIGRSPAANALRIATEDLIAELQVRRPELVAKSDEARFLEAWHYGVMARQMLSYHAAMAETSDARLVAMTGMRDAMMADTLISIVERERGKVLAFAHNLHLQRGMARWQLGPHALAYWPAGAQLGALLGPRFAVIGTGLGVSEDNGIGQPEPGTLEARLTATSGPGRFTPTHGGAGLSAAAISTLLTRSGSHKHPGYFPLTAESFTDFDWLAVLDRATYTRGAPPLPS